MANRDLTAERLREVLNYDPETGIFTRRLRTSNRVKVGDVVGTPTDGYLCGRVGNRLYVMHRLAWLYVYGVWPEKNLDHANGNRSDNRIANLREADHGENAENVVAHADNRTGYLGVTWCKLTCSYVARISRNRVTRHLGKFETAYEAHQAYLAAKRQLHGFQPVPRDQLNA
ncbi:HNH endonuclease signature motif containing protein [Paraburkholderia tropica]|uniref:HNH endonuclease signature motif containing protein n=1 Tax=Paraburkholderia tropica TaxID=92647 RepID=UPI001F4414FF|nr:HNH endonuclease signature motif containing protein [Paraburkholderia tropica]